MVATTLLDWQAKLRTGEITASGLLETALDRLMHLEPRLNAITQIDRDFARSAAQAADERIHGGDRAQPKDLRFRGAISHPTTPP